jgi:hypothetical protein
MSGTSTSRFTASGTVPSQEVLGHYHRFKFTNIYPKVKLQAYSQFSPTAVNDSTINIETRNVRYSGFRFQQLSKSTDTNQFGAFYLQSFIFDGDGVNIFETDGTKFTIYLPLDVNNNVISNVSAGIAGTDAVNLNQLNAAIISGTVTLTGNVTGSGVVGTPFATTIASTLDQIPDPIAAVTMNSQKITGLANGTVSTDAVNLGQMNSAISAGTITLTGNVTGSGTVGTSFATTIASRLNQIPTPTGAVSMNSQKLTSLATGTVSTDGVNLGQMNTAISSAIAASTITLTGNVTGSGVVGTPFATTIASTLNNIPLATGTVNLNTQTLSNAGNIGAGISSPIYPLQFATATSDCKICFYSTAANNFQIYGIGVLPGTLKYTVDSLSSAHVFYGAASSSTSTEFFRIKNTYATCVGGTGTFYARIPSIHISVTSGSYTTTPNVVFVKLNATTSATSGSVQFSTSNNRITYNGTDLSASVTGMVSGSLNVAFNDTSICTFAIYKNGSQIATTYTWGQSLTANQPFTVVFTPTMVTLSPGDYLEIWASSSVSTTVITVTRLNLSFAAC